jgi:nucleotide-binding universal stress UspA family protein
MKRFQKILVIFDSEARDGTALHLAWGLARDSGGSLTVVHMIPPLPQDIPYDLTGLDDLNEVLRSAAESSLTGAVEKLPESEVPVDTRVLRGHTAMEVTRAVMTQGYDLVVKGTGASERMGGPFLESVDMRLLRKCPCPVWLVKPGTHEKVSCIAAAVDPTDAEPDHQHLNESIIQLGLALARMEGAELHVLHAWAPWGKSLLRHKLRSEEFEGYKKKVRSRAAKAFQELLRPYDDRVPLHHRHLVEGEPEEVVPEFVRDREVDVVLMGTVARTGVPGFLIGNTAEMILGRVESSVLAVKPRGFVSPVELDGTD